MEEPQKQKKNITPAQIVTLCLLLFFVTPVGILYALWLIAGKKGVACGCGCMILPLILIILFFCFVNISESGEMVHKVDWLSDPSATKISYYKSHRWSVYEYKTSEKNFLKHANPSWKFKDITEPVTILRYLYMTKYNGNLMGGTPSDSQTTIRNGLIAEKRWKNGGGYIAVYDRDTGKAYIQTNSH